MSSQIAAISIQAVAKHFGSFKALKHVSMDINSGEFFTLLGPSGCGKTTLLRLIGGFEQTSEGRIYLYGDEIEKLPANKRPINTVFQHYSLFPHMTLTENIQFGMKMLGYGRREMESRAAEMLELVQLSQFSHRRPDELSGGQQQRVALARALAPKPRVLLLDEPLSALDLKLRQAMRLELKQIQQETGITFVFVTHDQEEALTMSDRIAVMSAGRVQQIGTPKEIYEEPANSFVADFIGETNLIDVEVASVASGQVTCRLPGGQLIPGPANSSAQKGQRGKLSIRPERLHLTINGEADLTATVDQMIYMGTDTLCIVRLPDGTVLSTRRQNTLDNEGSLLPGASVGVRIDHGASRLMLE